MIGAVLDSSVLIPQWSQLILQRIAADDDAVYQPIWSEWIIAETWRTLAWNRLRQIASPDEATWSRLSSSANAMMRHLLPVMQFVSIRTPSGTAPWPQLTDINDVPIWETAQLSGAQFVVSQNTSDFPPLATGHHAYLGVEYLTAIEFVEDVLGRSAEGVLNSPLPPGARIRSRRVPR